MPQLIPEDLLFTTIPDVFQDIYGFSIQYTGLAYIGRKYIKFAEQQLYH